MGDLAGDKKDGAFGLFDFKVKTDETGAPIYRPSNHNVQQPRRAAAQRLLHGQGDKGVHQLG